jgi:hypothetical protein
MTTQSLTHVCCNHDGVLNRRSFLRWSAAGAVAGATLGFGDAISVHAGEMRKNGMACILLFMNGGPSQMETFDPKPGTENGGQTKAIETAARGIQIAELWPKVAGQMKDISLIRTVTNKEGAHPRAVYQLHTGYVPTAAIKYPTFGSCAAKELGDAEFDLPGYVSITGRRGGSPGSGILGMQYAPLIVADPNKMPQNVERPRDVSEARLDRRLNLLKDVDAEFRDAGAPAPSADHQALYGGAARLVKSPRLKAFDLTKESDKMRDRYGRTNFGQACLLARRLVETGVTFVEIESDGWDTHFDNYDRVKTLAGPNDQGFATLVADLKERGMLDRTLVIWMGEFGRTPRINPRGGRDHFPAVSNIALAGGGIHGGRVIGATAADGMSIKERPVTVPDLFCTFCETLKINPRKENMGPLDRPVKIVDGGNPVKELL